MDDATSGKVLQMLQQQHDVQQEIKVSLAEHIEEDRAHLDEIRKDRVDQIKQNSELWQKQSRTEDRLGEGAKTMAIGRKVQEETLKQLEEAQKKIDEKVEERTTWSSQKSAIVVLAIIGFPVGAALWVKALVDSKADKSVEIKLDSKADKADVTDLSKKFDTKFDTMTLTILKALEQTQTPTKGR